MRITETPHTLVENAPLVLDHNEHPAATESDLVRLLPAFMRDRAGSVRSSALGIIRAVFERVWAACGHALHQTMTPASAEGRRLDEWGEWRKIPRLVAEEDGPYRARVMTDRDVVSPLAIRAAVVAACAQASPLVEPLVLEPSHDAAFCAPETALASEHYRLNVDAPTYDLYVSINGESCPWACFVSAEDKMLFAYDLTRMDVEPAALQRYGVYVVPAHDKALGWVVLPFLDGGELGPFAYAYPTSVGVDDFDDESFCMTIATVTSFAFPAGQSTFRRVVNEVEARRGCGVPWLAFADTRLLTAI